MAQSLSKVYVHITFSTKGRLPLINEEIKSSLFEYIGGICKGLECYPVKVGGYNNHIHILCTLSRKITQMKLLEEIKKQSSKWVKTKGKDYSKFYWQNGYGIFSVNPSEIDVVIRYIENQVTHHQKISFKNEYKAFLKKYNVDFKEEFLWD